MNKCGAGNQGFTLVELLVSLALLSLMTIYTANAFNSLRSMSRVADEMSREYEIDAALRHVRGAIADTRPHFQPDGVGGQEFLFEGSAHTLTFVTAATGERERGGLYVVTLSLEENGELVERRRLLGNTTNHDGTRTVLLRRVGDLRFRYADSGTKDESTEFSEWAVSGSLPQVIHVQITSDSVAQVASIHAVLRLAAP